MIGFELVERTWLRQMRPPDLPHLTVCLQKKSSARIRPEPTSRCRPGTVEKSCTLTDLVIVTKVFAGSFDQFHQPPYDFRMLARQIVSLFDIRFQIIKLHLLDSVYHSAGPAGPRRIRRPGQYQFPLAAADGIQAEVIVEIEGFGRRAASPGPTW